jgi:outer membrane protein OmpA-like peptidoglycan-associated protein
VAQTLAAIIRFGNGSSSLGADERHIVAQLAAIHAQTGGPIRLVGHASKSGGNLQSADAALVNFKISLDRATAVANELIRNGVPRSDILVEAAAASDSMAADAGIQNEAVDRRVEVFFGV